MKATPRDQISAFVCVPTTRTRFMAPYRRAAAALCDKALDLTDYLSALPSWSSSNIIPFDQELAQLDFRPTENVNPGHHFLVVDDVVDSGTSGAVVIKKIAEHYSETTFVFTVACALWVARSV
jgi:hypothetical protein